MDQTTTTSTNTVCSIRMMDSGAGFIIAEVKFDTISTNTNAMGKMISVNSANEGNMASAEASDVMTAVMNRLSRNPLYVKMDPTGKVMEVVNAAMLRDIILKDTASITTQSAPMLKSQLKNSVDPDALKTMVEMFTHNLPGKPVKTGEQWNITTPVNSGGMSLNVVTNYQLKSMKGNDAVISSESSVKASENAKPLEYPGAKITYDGITGLGKSDMTISTVSGLVIEQTTKMNITGDLNVSASGMNMQIPMKIISESSIKSI
jgi:hypothetical protein